MRSVQYYFYSFMEVDNHTIIIGPLVSSAYLNNKFMSEMQQRSLTITIHKVGPIPDPCIIGYYV